MEIVRISDSNKEIFSPFLGEDVSEDAMRTFFEGVGVTDGDDSAIGAIVYELLGKERAEESISSRICFASARSTDVFDAMLKEYTDQVVSEEAIARSCYELEDEGEAKAFCEKGFSFEERESDAIRLTLGEIARNKLAKKTKFPPYIKKLGELSLLQYRTAIKNAMLRGRRGAFEDMAYLPLRWFDTDISVCTASGNKANGLFLIRRTPSGTLIPAFLYAYGPEYQMDLSNMIAYAIRNALEVYPPDTPVCIIRKNDNTRAFTDKLLPGHKGEQIFCGSRKEK